jgi:putative transposase
MFSVRGEHSRKTTISATKTACFRYSAPDALLSLLEDFRCMCNDAVRIAVSSKPSNRFKLINLAYPRLKGYGLHTHYILSACEVAFSAYKNKKRKDFPYIERIFLKLDNQSYRLDHLLLRIPTTPRKYIFLVLQGSDYHSSLVDDPSLKRGSVTITPEVVSVALSKEVELAEAVGYIGLDANERNATVSATDGWDKQFEELGEVVEIKERYREVRAKITRTTRGDRRIGGELLARYGKRERNRTNSRLNKVTTEIVNYAKMHRLGIKMENLKGIRKLYRKGNGQSSSFRGRMNSWVFGKAQRQIDYKAKWDGVPVWYVNPRGTSSYCLCGSCVVAQANRKLYCPKCDIVWDRDDLASKNIMACAVPQVRPSKGSDEENPESRRTLAILGADGGKGSSEAGISRRATRTKS